MRRRRQADDPDPRPRIAKAWDGPAPIVPLNKCPPLLRRHLTAIRAQSLATFARDHLFVKLKQRHCIRPSSTAFYASMLSSKGFMKSSHLSLVIALICSVCNAAPTTRPTKSYTSDEMSADITEQAGGSVSGNIKMSGSVFPLVAKNTNGKLLGTFRGLDGRDVAFTGTVSDSTFTMDVNDHHYGLVRNNVA